MDEHQFYDDYRAYLAKVKKLPPSSADSYVAYLRGANRFFSPLSDPRVDYFASLCDDPSIANRIHSLDAILDAVKAEKEKPTPVRSRGTLGHYITAMKALKAYFESLGPSVRILNPSPARSARKNGPARIEQQNVPPLPYRGFDPDCEHVYYDPEIPDEEKVPGLAAYLEERYGRIIDYLMYALKPEINPDFLMKRIPVVLVKGHPADVHRIDVRRWVLDQWELLGHKLAAEEIITMLHGESKIFPILGEYIPDLSKPTESMIVLYYENDWGTPLQEYLALFEGVLAHEYAHHIHHLYLGATFHTYGKTATIIKESVADFASFAYLVDHHQPLVAEKKLEGWKEYFGSGWPYAEALWFFHIHGGFHISGSWIAKEFIDKLAAVFRESVSFARALETLRS